VIDFSHNLWNNKRSTEKQRTIIKILNRNSPRNDYMTNQ
jgi:hypothetical protein